MAKPPTVAKGSLSKAKNRSKDTSPNYLGSLTFSEDIPKGTKLWLAAWVNDGESGQYLSINGSFPEDKPSPGVTRPVREALDDEIPF